MQRELSSASAVDTARVQSIRQALEAGTYKIDAQVIADRMIDLERQLGA
jgi:negative regulator of flagellin synthesis FlgM